MRFIRPDIHTATTTLKESTRDHNLLVRLLLILLISITTFASAHAHDFVVDGIYYKINDDGTSVSVTYKGISATSELNEYSGDVVIPPNVTYKGITYPVTCIGSETFKSCYNITSVFIPNSITEIGVSAFKFCGWLKSVSIPTSVTKFSWGIFSGCTRLSTVKLPENISDIPTETFMDCTSLHSIVIPNSVTRIGEKAFYSSGLDSVVIPNSVTAIASEAFSGSHLNFVVIPNSVAQISEKAFYACSKLQSVLIPASVNTLSSDAFGNCSNLKKIACPDGLSLYCGSNVKHIRYDPINSIIEDGVLFDLNKTSIIFVTTNIKKEFQIPNSVSTIGDYAFSYCSGLTSVQIPNSVTTIGKNAFYNCNSIEKVQVFDLSSWLKINFMNDWSNPVYYSHNLYLNDNLITKCIIPQGTIGINDYAFVNCKSLTSLAIHNSVVAIGKQAFYNTGLTSVLLPNSVGEVDEKAFNADTVYAYPRPYVATRNNCGFTIKSLNLIGGPLTIISNIFPRQESCEITIGQSSFKHAPEGYEDLTIVAQGYNLGSTPGGVQLCDNNKAEITNLRANHRYHICGYTKYSDGSEVINDYDKYFTTHGLNLDCKSEVSPTAISAVFSYKMDDAKFKSHYIKHNGKQYDNNKITLTGLKPNTKYTISYTVTTEGGSSETKSFEFTTPKIELSMLPPKGVTSSNTIVAATTNLSDLITTAGFQWKKYDAPASLEPNEAYAAIYDGRLEGYLKNLQSTSYYNVRAFYKDPTEGTYVYSDWKTFDPSDFSYFEPTVHTYPIMECGSDTAIVRGYVLPGSDAIIKQGIEYWGNGAQNAPIKVFAPDYSSEDIQTIFASGQVMTVKLENLVPETDYKFRAFAITQAGTTYGEEQSFTTKHSGVTVVENSKPRIIGYYDLQGIRHEHPQQGFNIILYDNGTTKKVLFK